MTYVIYALAKLIGYSAWGYVGFRLHGRNPSFKQVLSIGSARWVVGLGIGAVLFFAVQPDKESAQAAYFAVYIPVRFFEWLLVGGLAYRQWPNFKRDPKFFYWILGGIAVSFLLDLTSPEMMENGRFCVGRCLC